jgi:hypothetical protein
VPLDAAPQQPKRIFIALLAPQEVKVKASSRVAQANFTRVEIVNTVTENAKKIRLETNKS